jgi:hypothetical protein
MSDPNPVQHMVDALFKLSILPENKQNGQYREIVRLMKVYIDVYCQHHIVEDLIDIDPDRSKTIRFCEYCNKDFTVTR